MGRINYTNSTSLNYIVPTTKRLCRIDLPNRKALSFFLFHLFGFYHFNFIYMLVVVSCGGGVFTWALPVPPPHTRFSDLAKLPGEEQVDIIVWGPPKFGKIFFQL